MSETISISAAFPVVEQPSYALNGGHPEQGFYMLDSSRVFEHSPSLKAAHVLLLDSDPVGRLGNYRAVFELGVGVEGYTPDEGSDPGLGKHGEEELVRVITFTTYVDHSLVSSKVLADFLEALWKLHPWEHPIIKVGSTLYVSPDT